MASKKQKKKILITKLIIILVLALILGGSILFSNQIEKLLKIGDHAVSAVADISVVENSDLKIHYINVGQADSTLIELPDGTKMLIDAGKSDEEDGTNLFNYLQNDLAISTIDYFIVTHGHEDHDGLASQVLDKFDVKTIYRPFQIACSASGTAIEQEDLDDYVNKAVNITTKSYQNFIKKAYSERYYSSEDGGYVDASVIVPHADMIPNAPDIGSTNGDVYFSFEFYAPPIDTTESATFSGATQTIGRPVKVYTNKNNASPIMLLTYQNQKFVFTGDAESEVESDFITKYKNDATVKIAFSNVSVYKAGHHGSYTSSTAKFLEFINPSYTICSCGKNNSYNHPSAAFITRWETQVATQGTARKQESPLRTDINGTIIFGVNADGSLVYCAGVAPSGFKLRWSYIALSIFVVLTVIVLMVKVNKNPVKTGKSIYSATKKAKKINSSRRNL